MPAVCCPDGACSRRSPAWAIARTEPRSSGQHRTGSHAFSARSPVCKRLHRASPGLQTEIGIRIEGMRALGSVEFRRLRVRHSAGAPPIWHSKLCTSPSSSHRSSCCRLQDGWEREASAVPAYSASSPPTLTGYFAWAFWLVSANGPFTVTVPWASESRTVTVVSFRRPGRVVRDPDRGRGHVDRALRRGISPRTR